MIRFCQADSLSLSPTCHDVTDDKWLDISGGEGEIPDKIGGDRDRVMIDEFDVKLNMVWDVEDDDQRHETTRMIETGMNNKLCTTPSMGRRKNQTYF